METLSPGAVLTELKNRGITLYLKEEKLKVKAKKGAMTPELQAAIKANKEALIELIKTASSAKASGSQKAGIGRKPANVEPMLSDGQERLWTLAQLASDSDVYNLPFIYEIRGGLNIERLKASVMAVASRQQVLRSSYRDLSDGPQIVFHDAIPLAFEYGDYRSEVLTQDDIYDLIARDTVKPFDLSQPPLWRLHLYQLEAERFILLGVFHHIIFDGWSADVFWNDLRHAYETPDKVQAQLPIEYVDYAYWHRTWLQSPAKAKELGYWQKVFADDVEAIKLPGQLGPSMGQNNEGELVSFKIPAELVNQLRDLAKKENYSLFMALTLIFNMTLSRYTEQEDLLICTPIAGRDQAETEGLVGFFNNIAVLRTQLEGDTPFRLQLKKMRDIILGASQNQVLPFQDVADLPNLRRIPLTRAFFALEEQTVTSKAFTLGDLTVETLPPRDYAADFDWSVFAKDLGDGLDGEIWFKRGIYDRAVVSDFASNLISVIETIVKRPTVTLNELPLFEDPTAAARENQTREVIAAASETETRLQMIWQEMFEMEEIGVTENFFEIGGHSMLAVRLFSEIEKRFEGQRLPLAALLHAPTVRQLAGIIDGDDGEVEWPLAVPIQTEGDRAPLFCVHGAGGNVLIYRDLSKYLKENDQPVYGLQSQGLDGQMPLHESVEEMATAYIAEIQKIQPQGPYMLAGYCLGGTIALEMAQQLNAQDQEVHFLGLLETYNWVNESKLTFSKKLVYNGQKLLFHWRNFAMLGGREKMTFLREKFKVLIDRTSIWYGSFKSSVSSNSEADTAGSEAVADDDQLLAKVWANNDEVADVYIPKPYKGVIHHFRPQQEYARYSDPQMGWDHIAQKGVETYQMPVFPAGMLLEPFVSQLAETIDTSIKATDEQGQSAQAHADGNGHQDNGTYIRGNGRRKLGINGHADKNQKVPELS